MSEPVIGGYDDGYRACPCFWGTSPGSLVARLLDLLPTFQGLRVLDAGCGEGKNAAYLAERGAKVSAFDVSAIAIERAKSHWPTSALIEWRIADIRDLEVPVAAFDLVIAYGLLHCLASKADVADAIAKLQRATRRGGLHVVCAFNARRQELHAHPGFNPVLVGHEWLARQYRGWELIEVSDADLTETHPHNGIEHTHSLTRLIAKVSHDPG